MSDFVIKKAKSLRGEISVPGDKSISHRGIMLGAISEGKTRLSGFLDAADCRSTIACFRGMGIDIDHEADNVIIHGKGLRGLEAPKEPLFVGNSGTTMRLMSGIVSGAGFEARLDGDESIRKRPMKRIIEPLTLMGADIKSENENGCAPLIIKKARLNGISYISPVASAQVKSCVIFAGLFAEGETRVTEPNVSRDHTERMLKGFGANIEAGDKTVILKPGAKLIGQDIVVPGDISSAAYYIAAGLIHPDAKLLIKNVNINPTRAGILSVVKDMGGKIKYENKRNVSGEEVADIYVESSELQGVEIRGEIIPTLIDELPVIAVMAAFAKGRTVIADAAELKVKESNRIDYICWNLSAMGADVTPTEDGMIINGGGQLCGANIACASDHRIAMSFAVAGLMSGDVLLDEPDCVRISYENFYDTLFSIVKL